MDSDYKYSDSTFNSEKIYSQADNVECSLALTDELDRIGFSEENRIAMSGTSCIQETFGQINQSLRNTPHCTVKVGSRAEGTTRSGMNSDEDVVMLMPTIYVYKKIQKRAYCQMDTHLIIMNDPITPSGYTKLRMVKNRKIVAIERKSQFYRKQERLRVYEKFMKDLVGRSVLSNQLIKFTRLKIDERNGPAETLLRNSSSAIDTDFVRAYMCDFIPDIARPWFHRIYSNWPSIDVRDMLSHLGCFVVPVGCPISAERELEWRFSFSLQEKYIMLNLNPTHYKCYIMLKLIKKYTLEPRVGKCISSYHCKTVLFYTIENTDKSIWNENNLFDCLTMCLKMIKQFVYDGFCPNYFIPEENMFIGKLNVENQLLLNDEFERLISDMEVIFKLIKQVADNLSCSLFSQAGNIHSELERVSIRASSDPNLLSVFGHKKMQLDLYNVDGFNFSEVCSNIDKHVLGKHLLGKHGLGKHVIMLQLQNAIEYINDARAFLKNINQRGKYLAMPLTLRYIFFSIQCPPAIDGSHWSKLALSSKPFWNTDSEKTLILEAFTLALHQIHTEIASLFSSIILTYEFQDFRSGMMVYYEIGKGVNYFTNRLKLTTFYYKQKQYAKCRNVFKELFIKQYATCYKCVCQDRQVLRRSYNTVKPPNGSIKTIVSIARDEMCCCVKFDIFELEAAFSPLFYEAFRSFATPESSRIDMDDYWFDRVVFDPVIYLNFMQLKCTYKLRFRPDNAKALSDIEKTIISHLPNRDLAHLETALNILGHCYLRKGWAVLALQCYKVSWTIRPLHNAAKWHVAFQMFGNSYK